MYHRMKLRVALAVCISALALTGCTSENDSGDTVNAATGALGDGAKAQVMQTASRLGTELAASQAETGAYPTSPVGLSVQPGSTVVGYAAVPPDGVRFCVVHSQTGAWALFDSTRGGVVTSGDSGATCV